MLFFLPVTLLRLEGAVVFFGSLALYSQVGGGWWWFAALFFAPDISIAVYLASASLGWRSYNLLHSYTGPLLLLAIALSGNREPLIALGLIWLAHIAWDRMLGFGMKLDEDFWTTHLGRIRAGRLLWEQLLRKLRR
jgi:hypothetical protein